MEKGKKYLLHAHVCRGVHNEIQDIHLYRCRAGYAAYLCITAEFTDGPAHNDLSVFRFQWIITAERTFAGGRGEASDVCAYKTLLRDGWRRRRQRNTRVPLRRRRPFRSCPEGRGARSSVRPGFGFWRPESEIVSVSASGQSILTYITNRLHSFAFWPGTGQTIRRVDRIRFYVSVAQRLWPRSSFSGIQC